MSNTQPSMREVSLTSSGVPASDGDGVRLTRIIASPSLDMVDPLLLLDKFESDQPEEYIGGFPTHPHRGFETVTYLLAGRMRHKDSAGHEGVIDAGGVQWMSAARGIIHSEMPEQKNGLLRGFQLWINLPAAEKMNPPAYQEFTADEIPTEINDTGVRIKVIAGQTEYGTQGPVKKITTDPLYLDIELDKYCSSSQMVPESHSCIIYVIDGALSIGNEQTPLTKGELAVMSPGNRINTTGSADCNRFLLIAAKQLGEPVARAGPFVMNTQQELKQAFDDFKQGLF